MKEIGEALKEQRESIGITIEEAALDLKLKESQIEAIENGDKDAFPDIFYLKYFIRDYSKYLGLNYEDMIDDFNEFLFDYTSKISMDDIEKARKQVQIKKNQEEHRIASPYTVEHRNRINIFKILLYIFIAILVVGGTYFCIKNINNPKQDTTTENIIK
jgi:cytoskeletal protein RodZ